VALNQTKTKQIKQVFKPKTIACILNTLSFSNKMGKLKPPKKKIEVIVEKSMIELYSLKKKKTKGTLECSVKKPATSSDSKFEKKIFNLFNLILFNIVKFKIKENGYFFLIFT
jgi:hypothetical protein